MSLKGSTALVTGGSRGIGREICLALAAEGADIVVNYAGNKAAAEETAEACRAFGVSVLTYCADVSVMTECEEMVTEVFKTFGRIDILVNNAGITRDNLLLRMSEEEFDSVITTNLKGAFACTKYVSKYMIKRRYGRIINISSVVGIGGNAGQCNYAASKAGIIGLTKASAKELASRNITVNAVAPGFIETDMSAKLSEDTRSRIIAGIAVGRPGTPADVANCVLFFAREESSYISGQVLCVDGIIQG